jgi:hypothetical protein
MLNKLPRDLLRVIFSKLTEDGRDIINLSLTSKRLNELLVLQKTKKTEENRKKKKRKKNNDLTRRSNECDEHSLLSVTEEDEEDYYDTDTDEDDDKDVKQEVNKLWRKICDDQEPVQSKGFAVLDELSAMFERCTDDDEEDDDDDDEDFEEKINNRKKWKDLYQWRRKILTSNERLRKIKEEQNNNNNNNNNNRYQNQKSNSRIAVCDEKSVFVCDAKEGGGQIQIMHETTMNRFMFTTLCWSNNSEMLSVLMQSIRGYSVLFYAPYENEIWRERMKDKFGNGSTLAIQNYNQNNKHKDNTYATSSKRRAWGKKLSIVTEDTDNELSVREDRYFHHDIVVDENQRVDGDHDGDVELDGVDDDDENNNNNNNVDDENNKTKKRRKVGQNNNNNNNIDDDDAKITTKNGKVMSLFPLSKKFFDIYESDDDDSEDNNDDDDHEALFNNAHSKKHKYAMFSERSESKRATTKKKHLMKRTKPLSPPPLINQIVLPKTMVPFAIQFAPCGTKLAIVAKEKHVPPTNENINTTLAAAALAAPAVAAHTPTVVVNPINEQHADVVQTVIGDEVVPASTAAAAAGADINDNNNNNNNNNNQVSVGVQANLNNNNNGNNNVQQQQQQQGGGLQQQQQVPAQAAPLPHPQQQQQQREFSLSMFDLVPTMNSLYGFSNQKQMKFPRVSREIMQKIEQKDASAFCSFAPDNSGDMIGVSKKLNSIRLIENATNSKPILFDNNRNTIINDSRGDRNNYDNNFDVSQRGLFKKQRLLKNDSSGVPLTFQFSEKEKKISQGNISLVADDDENEDLLGDDFAANSEEVKIMTEHVKMLQSWEQHDDEVVSGYLRFPFWTQTKKFICNVASHSISPTISRLATFLTPRGFNKRKRSNNNEGEFMQRSAGAATTTSGGGVPSLYGGTRKVSFSNQHRTRTLSQEQRKHERMLLEQSTRVPYSRSEKTARFCRKKDVLWEIGHESSTHNAHWVPGKQRENRFLESSRGHWLIPFTLPRSVPPVSYMMLVPAPEKGNGDNTLKKSLEEQKKIIINGGEKDDDGLEKDEKLYIENFINDAINSPTTSRERESRAQKSISKFEKLVVCEIQPASVFVQPEVTIPFVVAARPGAEHVAWSDERAVYIRRIDTKNGGPIGNAVKILDLNRCSFGMRNEYNAEFMKYEEYGQGLASEQQQQGGLIEPVLYFIAAMKWSNSGDRLLMCLCTVMGGSLQYRAYQWITWDPPRSFFNPSVSMADVCTGYYDGETMTLSRINGALMSIGSYFFPSRQFKERVLLTDGGLKQCWSPSEDAIVFPCQLSITKSTFNAAGGANFDSADNVNNNNMNEPHEAQQHQQAEAPQQPPDQQPDFVDTIVIQEFPLRGDFFEANQRMYQESDQMAIPYRAKFLSKAGGKNFIRVCEGKYAVWSP